MKDKRLILESILEKTSQKPTIHKHGHCYVAFQQFENNKEFLTFGIFSLEELYNMLKKTPDVCGIGIMIKNKVYHYETRKDVEELICCLNKELEVL